MTEFSIIGHTSSSSSSSSGSTIGGSLTSTSGFESSSSTGSGSTENSSSDTDNTNTSTNDANVSNGITSNGASNLATSPSTRQYIAVTQSSIIKRKGSPLKPESADVEVSVCFEMFKRIARYKSINSIRPQAKHYLQISF